MIAAALALLLTAAPASAQWDGGPGMRPHAPRLYARPWNTPTSPIYYGGTNTSRTYDPGVSSVTLDSCTVTIPPSSVSRVMIASGYYATGTDFTNGHGVRAQLMVDSAAITGVSSTSWAIASSQNAEGGFWYQVTPITIPGDGAAHTVSINVSDAGATGNLTFKTRWVIAQQVSP